VADDHNSPFDGASSFAAHSKQVRQAFGSIITATSTGFPSESPLNPGFRADLSNAETVEPIKDFYELPKVSLVLKAIRVAKSKLVVSKVFFQLINTPFSEPEEILSWNVGFEYHKPG